MPLQPANRRPTRQQRRRQGQRRLAALVLAVAVLIVIVIVATSGGGPSRSATTSGTRGGAHSRSGAHAHGRAAHPAPPDPLTTSAMRALVARRHGQVSVAVDDLTARREWLLNPGARDQTASIIKMDILETLLHQTQASDGSIASAETPTAQGMIEASDNDDATALWNQIGAASGIAAYNTDAGLTQTTPAGGGLWGETLTSAADQIKLLRHLALRNRLLTLAARRYELYLMENIDPGENWGVTGGVPRGVTVALKNGWVPLTSNVDWEVNSDGWVKGDGRDYLISVLTAHDPSEQYGIDTIESVSRLIWSGLRG